MVNVKVNGNRFRFRLRSRHVQTTFTPICLFAQTRESENRHVPQSVRFIVAGKTNLPCELFHGFGISIDLSLFLPK